MRLALYLCSYAALLYFLAGYVVRLLTWSSYAPLPVLPHRAVSLCVVLKALCDILLLRRLLRVNDVLWLGEWVFHASLLILFLGHLKCLLDPVPAMVDAMEVPARIAAWLLPASLLYISVMKIIIEKKPYISSYNFLILGLMMVSCLSGLLMKYSFRADLAGIKHFMLGLVTFHMAEPPGSLVFLLHYFVFLALLTSLPS